MPQYLSQAAAAPALVNTASIATSQQAQVMEQPIDLTVQAPPNQYNAAIAQEMQLTRQMVAVLKGAPASNGSNGSTSNTSGTDSQTITITGPGGSAAPSAAPWLNMPQNGRPFHYQLAVNCPAPGTDDFVVVSLIVPNGWKAAIWSISNNYTAAGFDEGSGDLIWRISVDGAYSPGFDSITTTLGKITEPRKLQGPIIAESNQVIAYTVTVAAGAPFPTGAAAKIICSFDGWIYPEV